MTEDKKRLVIETEDLPPDPAARSAADAPTQAMQTQLPSIEGVRPQATPVAVGGPSLSFGGTLPNGIVAAAIAALAGWGAFRLFFAHPPLTSDLVGLAAREFAVSERSSRLSSSPGKTPGPGSGRRPDARRWLERCWAPSAARPPARWRS